jgi:hypothetical protein
LSEKTIGKIIGGGRRWKKRSNVSIDGSIFAVIYQYRVVAYFISCVGVIQCGWKSALVRITVIKVPFNIFQVKRFVGILGVSTEYKQKVKGGDYWELSHCK